MATATRSYTGSTGAGYYITITSNTNNINITGATFNPTSLYPTVTAQITKSGLSYANLGIGLDTTISYVYASYDISSTWSSGATKTLSMECESSIDTSWVFSASNKTVRSVAVIYSGSIYGYCTDRDGMWTDSLDYRSMGTVNLSQTITLNVPPTFSETFSYTGDFSGVPYANLTTANVTLSSLTAYYGGDFTGVGKAEFTIGSQTVIKANPVNNDVLSIPLNAVGTFTPTVKITDSRGQVTMHTLNAITVQGYVAPSVNFSVERTLSTGVPDDEGESATVTATFNFTDAIATLSAPTIAVTDDSGVSQTVSTTWYSTRANDGTLSGSVTWSNLSSGDTVYGLVSITGDFDTQKSYQIGVTPQDSEGTGTTVTQTLGGAYYTVDFYAGGHGIAFGQPASQTGFYCNMDAHLQQGVDVTGDITTTGDITATGNATIDGTTETLDVYVDLPNYQTASTTDKSIYDAIVALGWDSDVLVN